MTAAPSVQDRDNLRELIREKRREVAKTAQQLADLSDGIITWTQWNPDITCTDRQEAAIDECGIALDAARRELARLVAKRDGQTAGAR